MDPIIEIFKKGVESSQCDQKDICMVTDIAYHPEVTDYLGMDLFHTSRGRAIPFATGMKLANPRLKLAVFIGDLATLGGNHFVHAGRRNMDIHVICINHYHYKKVGGEYAPGVFPRVPLSPYGSFDEPLNIPHLARSCGAVYVARWTLLHANQLSHAIAESLRKTGFSVVDVISNEPDILDFYFQHSEIKNGEDTLNVKIVPDGKIIVGQFVDRERPNFIDSYNEQMTKVLGDKFVKIEV
ncbi:2-oxoacid:ferredoxin oxidoreductase subunit beta [bacterium]|nr:2-oxoacid:ferredoxin oxidoreductase subunit beta [bacterium]